MWTYAFVHTHKYIYTCTDMYIYGTRQCICVLATVCVHNIQLTIYNLQYTTCNLFAPIVYIYVFIIYINIYVCIFYIIYISIYIYIYMYMYTNIPIYVYIYIYICISQQEFCFNDRWANVTSCDREGFRKERCFVTVVTACRYVVARHIVSTHSEGGGILKERWPVTVWQYVEICSRTSQRVTHTWTHVGTMRFRSPVGCCDKSRRANVICQLCADRERWRHRDFRIHT